MSDAGGTDTTTIDISRDDSFQAFWDSAYAEFGYAYTRVDLMTGYEGQVLLAAAFSTSAVGLQVESAVGAVEITADAGSSLTFNGQTCRFEAATLLADCNDAHAALQLVEAEVTTMKNQLTSLESTVDHLESGGFWLNGMAMMARL